MQMKKNQRQKLKKFSGCSGNEKDWSQAKKKACSGKNKKRTIFE